VLCFPNAKINIGLNITEKRKDGFHNLETIFYPVSICDALEFTNLSAPNPNKPYTFHNSGISVEVPDEENIVIKAYELIRKNYQLPALQIHLHKNIPFGAGLGGGSADAAFMITSLNEAYNLNIPVEKQEEYASKLGSDCSFFIRNQPTFAYGRGELFKPVTLDLNNYFILMIKPDIAVSTAEAYANIRPHQPEASLLDLIQLPIKEWEGKIINDFEESIFPKHPELKKIKEEIYASGALYAAMSGSGSTIYGIFDKEPEASPTLQKHFTWKGKL
jgi:4-diphosphocytidyl-2-C-methyl-D-erythritol kinase